MSVSINVYRNTYMYLFTPSRTASQTTAEILDIHVETGIWRKPDVGTNPLWRWPDIGKHHYNQCGWGIVLEVEWNCMLCLSQDPLALKDNTFSQWKTIKSLVYLCSTLVNCRNAKNNSSCLPTYNIMPMQCMVLVCTSCMPTGCQNVLTKFQYGGAL